MRQPEELSGPLGFIDGSINIPLFSLTKKQVSLVPYLDKEVVVICRSGHRASTAAQIMFKAGVKKIKVLVGGMLAWQEM